MQYSDVSLRLKNVVGGFVDISMTYHNTFNTLLMQVRVAAYLPSNPENTFITLSVAVPNSSINTAWKFRDVY